MTVATPPEQLSDAARSFLSNGPLKLLIGEERVDGVSTFETLDPATGNAIAEVAQAGPEQVDRAVAAGRAAGEAGPGGRAPTAARAAFEDGLWASAPAAERGKLIQRLSQLIAENADELAELESLDNGKPVTLAKIVDVGATVAHYEYFAGWPTKIEGDVIPVRAPNTLCYTRKEPVGVCGQIIPWNFPLLMAAWKTAPALAAGCTIVLKPAEQTPLTALRLGELALEAGIPPGVFNVVTGDGETGAAIVDHPGVDKIAFTGSTAVGREIGAKAGGALKRVTLELGGKSPNIILPDADLEAAIKGSFQGIYFNSGQSCCGLQRVYVHHGIYQKFVEGFIDLTRRYAGAQLVAREADELAAQRV